MRFAFVLGSGMHRAVPAALVVLFHAAQARAEGPVHARTGSVRLEYSAPPGCPDEDELRNVVSAFMKRDPFVPSGKAVRAEFVFRASLTQRPHGFRVRMELQNATGRILWQRPSISDVRCSYLIETIGQTEIPIVLDAPVPKPMRNQPPPTPSPAELPPPEPPAARPWRPSFLLGGRVAAAFGAAPQPTGSVTVDVGAGWRFAMVSLEGRSDVPVSAHGVVRSSIFAGTLVPCGRYRVVFACILMSVGAFHGTQETSSAFQARDVPYVAGGARAGVAWPSSGAVALRVSADILGRFSSSVPGSPVGAFVGGGLVARFGGS